MKARNVFALALVFIFVLIVPKRTMFAQTIPHGAFVSTGMNLNDFRTGLFKHDSGIKEYPHHLAGHGSEVAMGWQNATAWSLGVDCFENRVSGTGNWLDVDGLSAEELAYAAVAKGVTDVKTRGCMSVLAKAFGKKAIRPYAEVGAGAGTMKVTFNGTATATDPEDGEQFTVPASDSVLRTIPLGIFGGGVEFRTRSGLSLQAGYRLQESHAFVFHLRYFPFWHRPVMMAKATPEVSGR